MITAKLDLPYGRLRPAATERDGEAIPFVGLAGECNALDRGFFSEGNNLAVIEQYRRAVELDPSDPVLTNHLGSLYSASGQIEEALAGNPDHLTDKQRSLHLRSFLELERLGDAVSFVSLQHGPAVMQLVEGARSVRVRDACSNARDFADTAEVVAGSIW
jgi:hypothetical protein